MTSKETEDELWHKLGNEYAPDHSFNAQEIWERWRNHRVWRVIWSILSALALFAGCYASGLEEWWLNGPIAILGGFTCFTYLKRKSILTPHEEAVASEWNEIRHGVALLWAWRMLNEQCQLDALLLTHPHTSQYYLPCVKEILLIKEAILKRRIATNSGRWWLEGVAKS